MNSTFTHFDIEQFKEEAWARKKSLKIRLSKAQDTVAQEHGYANWSLLMKAFNGRDPKQVVLEALREYVKSLSDYDITRLFLNGTIWIYRDDVKNDKVDRDSFQRLGLQYDGMTRQYTNGWECIVDMDGAPEAYKLESEVHEDDDEDEIGPWPIISTDKARELIIDTLDQHVEGNFDSVLAAIDQAQSEVDYQ